MDAIDLAADAAEQFNENSIQSVRDRAHVKLLHSGACRYCESVVAAPLIFCDVECRDDWEREKRITELRGRYR